MKELKKLKSAYALLNILIENDVTRIPFILFAFKRIYSLYLNTDELNEVIKFINYEFIVCDTGKLTKKAKKKYLKENDCNEIFLNAPKIEVESETNAISFEYYANYILKAILTDIKKLLKDENFIKKYLPSYELDNLNYYFQSDEYYKSHENSFIDAYNEFQKLKICIGIVERLIEYHTEIPNEEDDQEGEEGDNYSSLIATEAIQSIYDEYSILLRKDQFRLAISYFARKYSLCWNELYDGVDSYGQRELVYSFPVDLETILSIWDDLEMEISNFIDDDEEEEEEDSRNHYVDGPFFSRQNNDEDIMRIKKDPWGNLYTEGGKMWDAHNDNDNRRNDDDY